MWYATAKSSEESSGLFPPGAKLPPNYVYHNTWASLLPVIEREGFSQGTFTPKLYAFSGDIWLAVKRDKLVNPQEGKYGPTTAIESVWQDEKGDDTNIIPPNEIYLVDKDGRVIRRLDQPAVVAKTASYTYHFLRNTEHAPRIISDDFAQSIEPAGKYMTVGGPDLAESYRYLESKGLTNYEYGQVTFENPLFIEHGTTGHGGWKTKLSEMYGGKHGLRLSRAIMADGYDAVITLDKSQPVETVSLKGIAPEPLGLPDGGKWIPVESSAIRAVAYYEPLGMLEFKLKDGQEYSFRDIPKEEFDALMASPSKGRFFSDLVKTYRARRKSGSK
jgi:hypothetical protein